MEFNIAEIRKKQNDRRNEIISEFYKSLNNYIDKMYQDFCIEDKLSEIVYTDRLNYLKNFIHDKFEIYEDKIPVSFFDYFNHKLKLDHYLEDRYVNFRSGINLLGDMKNHLEKYSMIEVKKEEYSEEITMREDNGEYLIYA